MTVFREEVDRDDETETVRESSAYVKPDVEELEMLLEAYFVQIDGTLNKLYHVCSILLIHSLSFFLRGLFTDYPNSIFARLDCFGITHGFL
jgi:hypothetical protein